MRTALTVVTPLTSSTALTTMKMTEFFPAAVAGAALGAKRPCLITSKERQQRKEARLEEARLEEAQQKLQKPDLQVLADLKAEYPHRRRRYKSENNDQGEYVEYPIEVLEQYRRPLPVNWTKGGTATGRVLAKARGYLMPLNITLKMCADAKSTIVFSVIETLTLHEKPAVGRSFWGVRRLLSLFVDSPAVAFVSEFFGRASTSTMLAAYLAAHFGGLDGPTKDITITKGKHTGFHLAPKDLAHLQVGHAEFVSGEAIGGEVAGELRLFSFSRSLAPGKLQAQALSAPTAVGRTVNARTLIDLNMGHGLHCEIGRLASEAPNAYCDAEVARVSALLFA